MAKHLCLAQEACEAISGPKDVMTLAEQFVKEHEKLLRQTKKIAMLDIFSGTGSVTQAARESGLFKHVYTLDIVFTAEPDINEDLMEWDYYAWYSMIARCTSSIIDFSMGQPTMQQLLSFS